MKTLTLPERVRVFVLRPCGDEGSVLSLSNLPAMYARFAMHFRSVRFKIGKERVPDRKMSVIHNIIHFKQVYKLFGP